MRLPWDSVYWQLREVKPPTDLGRREMLRSVRLQWLALCAVKYVRRVGGLFCSVFYH
jgi:hypothetical protein